MDDSPAVKGTLDGGAGTAGGGPSPSRQEPWASIETLPQFTSPRCHSLISKMGHLLPPSPQHAGPQRRSRPDWKALTYSLVFFTCSEIITNLHKSGHSRRHPLTDLLSAGGQAIKWQPHTLVGELPAALGPSFPVSEMEILLQKLTRRFSGMMYARSTETLLLNDGSLLPQA